MKPEQYKSMMEFQTEQFKKYKYPQPNSVASYFNIRLNRIGKKYPQPVADPRWGKAGAVAPLSPQRELTIFLFFIFLVTSPSIYFQ